MKKEYIKPNMTLARIQQQCIICTSNLSAVSSNAGITSTFSGYNGDARVKLNGYNVWDDDWSE